MTALLASPWAVVAISIALAGVIALAGRAGSRVAPVLASVGPVFVCVLAAGVLSETAFTDPAAAPWTSALASSGQLPWFTAGEVSLGFGWALDTLSGVMLGVVGVVSLCVVVFSIGYLHGDPGWSRYFALLSLFSGSMAMLVMADGFLTLFVGWELVGACSYLLIGFWFAKPAAANAAMKAFLTTRVGDVAMLVGLGVLWWVVGTLSYQALASELAGVPSNWVSAAAVLIALGAMGKSAQFPLHAWLPDAMEGPTPVSALIHAATMVAAGVFVVVRMWPLFELSPAAQGVLLAAGCISALGAAVIATVQRDIKKVLAYSTVSQLGFMFAALGCGAYTAAFFHLVTHAAFKALLFLGSGSVIHGTGTQDIRSMGGLRRTMPVTFVTWVIGVLALAGLPGLAGFFSKDAVLEGVWHHSPVAGVVLFAATALTGYYTARTTRLVFFGDSRRDIHAHESPISMLLPLGLLAIPALALGWLGTTLYELLGAEPEPLALGISAAAVLLAAVGAGAGWRVGASPRTDAIMCSRLGRTGRFVTGAFHWDELVDRVVVRPCIVASRALWAWCDQLLIDGAVDGAARVATRASRALSRLQNGDGQRYATAIAVGVALMLAATAMIGR